METTISNKFTGYSKTIKTKGFPSVSTVRKYLRESKASDCQSTTVIVIDGDRYTINQGELVRF